MFILHNTFRELEGLPSFIENNILNYQALKHAKRMARLGWLSDYKLKESLDKLQQFTEIVWNISLGSNPEIASKKIVNMPETRSKILGNYDQFGSGSFKGKNEIRYWCILYGKLRNPKICEQLSNQLDKIGESISNLDENTEQGRRYINELIDQQSLIIQLMKDNNCD